PAGRAGQRGGRPDATDDSESGKAGESQACRPRRGLAAAVVGELLDEHCFLLAGSWPGWLICEEAAPACLADNWCNPSEGLNSPKSAGQDVVRVRRLAPTSASRRP